jgi:phosphohistidine phosphatase
MDFYVLRHGAAEDRGPLWPDDETRPLTADGRAKTREVAAGLKQLGVAPGAIYTSPLVRARQTAEIVARELGLAERLRETAHLAPGGTADGLLGAIAAETPGAASVLVVGHEPDLGLLVSRLLTGDERAVNVPLKKAGLALVELDQVPPQGKGAFKWLLAPGHLRAIGKGK